MNKSLQTPIPDTVTDAYFENINEDKTWTRVNTQNAIHMMGPENIDIAGSNSFY